MILNSNMETLQSNALPLSYTPQGDSGLHFHLSSPPDIFLSEFSSQDWFFADTTDQCYGNSNNNNWHL